MGNGLRQQVVVFICSALLAMSAFAQVDCSTVAAPSASNFGPYCDGSTIALSTPEVTGATYSWSGPNNFASTDREPTLANATAANSGMYLVTVTANGCTSPQGSTNVVVNAPPPTMARCTSVLGPQVGGALRVIRQTDARAASQGSAWRRILPPR